MADLNDLIAFANAVTPTVQDLVNQWLNNTQPADARDANAAVASLQKLLAEANQQTTRTPDQCVAVLAAQHAALTEILIQAASNSGVSIPATKVEIIQEQLLALKSASGQVAVMAALAPLATLLQPADIATISTNLQAARDGIQQRETTQTILDTVIDVAIIASQIAVKIAAA